MKKTNTYTHLLIPTLDSLAQAHIHLVAFFFYIYRSIPLTRMQRYTQLAYLFPQCETSFLSRDGRVAECTMRQRAWSVRFLVLAA